MDKKKVLMGTVIASSVLVSGMALPSVNAKEVSTSINSMNASFQHGLLDGTYSMATVIDNKADQKKLTVKDVKELINKQFTSEEETKTVEIKEITLGDKTIDVGNENALVPTGSIVELKSGRKITVVLYGDVNQDGKVGSQDALEILEVVAGKVTLEDDAVKKAANINVAMDKDDNNINVMDALKILEYGAESLDENDTLVSKTLQPKEEEAADAVLGARVAVVTDDSKAKMGDQAKNYEQNMSYVKSVVVDGNTITITADLANMVSYKSTTQDNQSAKWVGILLKTDVARSSLIGGTDHGYYNIENGKEKEDSAVFGADDNEILLWFDAAIAAKKYENVKIKTEDGTELTFNVVIEDEATTTTTGEITQREVATVEAFTNSLSSNETTSVVLAGDIKLTGEQEEALEIEAEQTKEIDLNGHKIETEKGINNKGNLTIKDSKETTTIRVLNSVRSAIATISQEGETANEGIIATKGHAITNETGAELTIESGYYDAQENGKAALYNKGTVTINGGTFTRSKQSETGNSNTYYTVVNHGTMTVNGGTFDNKGNYSSMLENGFYSSEETDYSTVNPTLTINGGTFTGGLNTIKNDDNATLTIGSEESQKTLKFENSNQAILLNWNVATIKNGTFNYTGDKSIILNGAGTNDETDEHDKGILTVSGGTFTVSEEQAVFIKHFSADHVGKVTVDKENVKFSGEYGEDYQEQLESE